MPILVYKPEGLSEDRWRRWDISANTLSSVVLERIEDATDWTSGEWMKKFDAGSVKAMHALLWSLMRQTDPAIAYESVQFTMDEVDIEDDPGDKPAPKARKASKPKSGNPSVS